VRLFSLCFLFFSYHLVVTAIFSIIIIYEVKGPFFLVFADDGQRRSEEPAKFRGLN
jgi:hypothetical protein